MAEIRVGTQLGETMGIMPTLATDAVPLVHPATLFEELQWGRATVVDVRGPEEVFQFGLISGAWWIPFRQLAARAAELRRAKTRLVTVCSDGARAKEAAMTLLARGFSVRALEGGMAAWIAKGLPVRQLAPLRT